MSSLFLKHLAYLGPNKEPASVSFTQGLNVVCGASETGKSFIVESIDFMLGGGEPPRDVPERAGYDRSRLLVECEGWPPLGLERSVEGGNFSCYVEELLDGKPTAEPSVLRAQHSAARQDTLSHVLLERIGLTDKLLRRNRAGDTRSLSFRDLARLVVVIEEEIQRRSSPLVSGQFVQATPEYAAFKLLLTGTDDSALVSAKTATQARESVSGKIDLLSQMIEDLQLEIDEAGHDEAELLDQQAKLEESIDEQNRALNEAQGTLTSLLEDRGRIASEIRNRRARLAEIEELTRRFSLLDRHYTSDLKRLEAIHESGSFFVHLERRTCPLCGTPPGEQHLDADCDGNVETVIQAAGAEMEKIHRLQRELSETVNSLKIEQETINAELPNFVSTYDELNGQLSEIARPEVSNQRGSFNQLVSKRAEVAAALDKIERLKRLIAQREELDSDDTDGGRSTETRTQIPKVTLDQFSQTVERILQEWHYPNAQRVFFDETARDFQIAGKARGSTGKGLRAISHAAVTVGLLEFCLEHNLPHPGFIILDSPLLAYWKPEGDEDDLRGTDIKECFYEYLLGFKNDAQIIIVENEHPQNSISDRSNVIVFTKNPHQGRYGFFPPLDQ